MNKRLQLLNFCQLLGIALVSLISVSANAQTGTVQNGTQITDITGNSNQVYQIINQNIYNHPRQRDGNGKKDKKPKMNNSSNSDSHQSNGDRESRGEQRRDRNDDD